MTSQKAFQTFLRLQITVGYDILDMSSSVTGYLKCNSICLIRSLVRDLAVQFTVKTVSNHVLTTDDVTQIVINVIQQGSILTVFHSVVLFDALLRVS